MSSQIILIRKVKEPYGWMGNMAPYPVVYDGLHYRTTEALFQCLRFDDPGIQAAIRDQTSPMAAKMVAKKNVAQAIIEPRSEADLDNMKLCLGLKLRHYPELAFKLQETKPARIIEDCSKRPSESGLFWGAAWQNGRWEGQNWLGRLWMEIRDVE